MEQNILFGVPVERASKREIFAVCRQWLADSISVSPCRQIVTVNPEFLMEARKNQEFLRVLQHADLRIADGFGLVCASLLLHGFKKNLFRMTGVELTDILAQLCAQAGKKIYLIGADRGIAEKAAEVLQKKFPSLIIVGAEEGIPKNVSDSVELSEELCARISAVGADVLLVAFGAPKQDIWIARNRERLLGVKIAVGVGGTFDYLAGVVPYAPYALRIIGLEWLFRLITQAYRLNRIITAVIRFPLVVIFEKLKK